MMDKKQKSILHFKGQVSYTCPCCKHDVIDSVDLVDSEIMEEPQTIDPQTIRETREIMNKYFALATEKAKQLNFPKDAKWSIFCRTEIINDEVKDMKKSDAEEIKELCLKIKDTFDKFPGKGLLSQLREKVEAVAHAEPIESELSTPLFDIAETIENILNESNCYFEEFLNEAAEDRLLEYCYKHRLRSEECPYKYEDEDDD